MEKNLNKALKSHRFIFLPFISTKLSSLCCFGSKSPTLLCLCTSPETPRAGNLNVPTPRENFYMKINRNGGCSMAEVEGGVCAHVLVFWDFLKEKLLHSILSRLRRTHFQLKISQVFLLCWFWYLQVAKYVCASQC